MFKRFFAPAPRYAVGGVVYRYTSKGALELLLIKKQSGGWSLPKGHVEQGERNEEALRRELREETGLEVQIEQPVHQICYQITKRGRPCPKIVDYYLVCPTGGRLRPGREEGIRKVRWFALKEALARVQNERVQEVIERAVQVVPPHRLAA